MGDEGDYKVRIGAEVRARLLAHEGIVYVPGTLLELFTLPGFLAADECAHLIAMIDARRQPSRVLGPAPDPEFRTSESCNLDPADAFVQAIEAKIAGLTGIAPSHGETIQGQRYAVGQQFKPHYDFFSPGQPYWDEQERNGGQRTWTAMMFLNAVEGGGETMFGREGIKVRPRTGTLLAWNNLDTEGKPTSAAIHQGMPVIAGVKYIITKWYRERPWASTPSQYAR